MLKIEIKFKFWLTICNRKIVPTQLFESINS